MCDFHVRRFESNEVCVVYGRLQGDSCFERGFTDLTITSKEHDHLNLLGVLEREHGLLGREAFFLGLFLIFERIGFVISVLVSCYELEASDCGLGDTLEICNIDMASTFSSLDMEREVYVGEEVSVFEQLELSHFLCNNVSQLLSEGENHHSFLTDSSFQLISGHCSQLVLMVGVCQEVVTAS